MGTFPTEEEPDQSVRICACTGASCSQEICQAIEEADTFCGAALAGEVGIGAVSKGCVVRLCAGGAEAIDWLEGCERKGGGILSRDCLEKVKEDQRGGEQDGC